MQGKMSAIGSLPDSINFDYGSPSTNMGIDQQTCWNTLRDPAKSRLSEYQTAPGGTDLLMTQDARSLSRWNNDEPGSRNLQSGINRDERISQNGWSSSITPSAGSGSRLEDQVYNPTGVISRNGVNLNLNENPLASSSSFVWTSNSGLSSQNLDINVGPLERRMIPPSSSSSEAFAASSGSGGFLVEEDDDSMPDYSVNGRRFSCKRKSIEGNPGQSSSSGSCFSREGSMWQAVTPHSEERNDSSSVSTRVGTSHGVSIPDTVNPRLRLGIGGVAPDSVYAPNVGVAAAPSRRNYRVRMNPTGDQDSLPNNSSLPRVAAAGHSDVPPGHRPLRFVPANPPLVLNPPVHPENVAAPQGQSVVLRLHALRRNAQSIRSSGVSTSRVGSTSASFVSEGNAPLLEDLNSSPVPRNISEHPMFMPSAEVRNSSAHNPPVWNSNGGIGTSTRHIASSSRAGPGSGSQSSSGPTMGSHRHPSSSQYSRRLSEYVRRSLLSSAGCESGLHHGSTFAPGSAPSSQEPILPSANGPRGQNLPSSRSAMWMDMHGDGAIGLPYSLRTLAAGGGEGRSRLVSEIRNVLDSMRRGEGLRFEDVMLLDPTVLFGMADIHDEHRDMRLDVDNMSYEELLALEERIGDVSTGLSEEKILARLKQTKYLTITREDQAEVEPCCICQEEYKDGEGMGTLDCGHEFHAQCVKQWLSQKNSCPICKTTGLAA